jgi:hypothetical protein
MISLYLVDILKCRLICDMLDILAILSHIFSWDVLIWFNSMIYDILTDTRFSTVAAEVT